MTWRIPYMPALDGLRAIALFVILAFHAGYSTLIHGGYLPLTSFFVLSGFLITSLLLRERTVKGRISLRSFWERRARRLVPAALLTFPLVGAYLAATPEVTPGVRGDAFASLTWWANWRFILSERPYVDAFSDPSPFQHFWSLAVEEQFYLFIPLIAVGLLAVRKGRRDLFAATVVVMTAASIIWMNVVHEPGGPPLRAYFGTDTRAGEILVGVLLALVLVGPNGLRRFSGAWRAVLEVAGVAALGLTVVSWFVVQEYDDRLYEGGLILISLLAAVVVTAATQPGSAVERLLSFRPLVEVGKISYGVYLFHWPIFLLLSPQNTGLRRSLNFGLATTVTFALALLSYHLIEKPIRTGAIAPRFAAIGWANATAAALAVVVIGTSIGPKTPDVDLVVGEGELRLVTPTGSTVLDNPEAAGTSTTTTTDPSSSTTSTSAPGDTSGGAPPVSGVSADGAPQPPPTTSPSPPLKILFVGDSLADFMAEGMALWIEEEGVTPDGRGVHLLKLSKYGCGFTRGDDVLRWPNGKTVTPPAACADWPQEFSATIASFEPDVIVAHAGIGDLFDRQRERQGPFLPPTDPAIASYLIGEYTAAAKTLASTSAPLLWTNAPCTQRYLYTGSGDPAAGNERIDWFNDTVVPAIDAVPGVRVLDLHRALCPSGDFTNDLFGLAGARPDGVHLSIEAAVALSDQWLMPMVFEATNS